MTLNPDTQAFIDMLESANADAPPTSEQSPEYARDGYQALAHVLGPGPELGGGVEDSHIPGPAGDIPIRVYRPTTGGPHPALVFFHGGGFVIGDLETHDKECRLLCEKAGCLVLAVDYRLAPEDRFPAAVEDAWAAVQWVNQHGAQIGIDTKRVAVGGDSAGGNLAAVTALMARDADIDLKLQMLVYPATDASRHHDSFDENRDGPLLTIEIIDWFWSHYLGPEPSEEILSDWRFSPAQAFNHTGVAPAYLATCSADPLRDEGNEYAQLLRSAKVPVTHSMFEGEPHVLFQLFNVCEGAKTLIEECAAALATAFE
ncbi:MAG: alpha/beta hydrolase [Actinomycetota bacterium]|jgi:acetyl esterase|nr:alpha/beta hydrolase [Actinomycetota bacterium]